MHRFVVAGALALVIAGALLLFPLGTSTALPTTATPKTAVATTPTPAASTTAPPPASPTIGPIPDGYRIRIPRLSIDLPIAEGDVQRDTVVQQTPEGFAFHLPGTAIPGSGSNTYLYAHARRGMFLSLWNARVGDEVLISPPAGGPITYVVTEVHPRVPPDDISWVQPTTAERLTLQTSTGPSREDPRFVVIAAPS
jgi:LPXTG-site transpeptidase (sortase) family protein